MSRREYGGGSIEKRGPNTFRVTVPFPRDGSDASRRRRRFTVHGTQRDAQRALREALSDRDKGILLSGKPPTLCAWLSMWLKQHAADRQLAPTTVIRYERTIRLGINPVLGHLRLDELQPRHFIDFQASESVSRDHRTRGIKLLKRALADAVIAGLIGRNPAESIRAPKVTPPPERRALSDAEVKLLLEAASETRYPVPLALAVSTGLRQGELLALTWDDIDFDVRRLSVRRGLRTLPGEGVQLAPVKTQNALRAIDLSERMTALLRSHRIAQQETRLRLGGIWQANDFVFPSGVGTAWSPRNFYRGYRTIVDRAGIDNPQSVVFHTLRHTAATHWIKASVDIYVVSRRLGHASAAFTMNTYGHLLPGMQQVAAVAMDHLIG